MKKRSSMLKKATSLALALTFATTAMSLPAFAQSVDSSPNAVGTTQSGTPNSSANVPADVKPVKTYTVELGKTYKLPADVKQAGDGYSPSNSSILKVDGKTGSFTTLKNGTAYIVIANNGKTRYIKVVVGNGTTATNTVTQTKSALTGYTVTVNDKTTLATSSGSKTMKGTYYFYSANGTVLGSISWETLNNIFTATRHQGDSDSWLANEFNVYRGLITTTGSSGTHASENSSTVNIITDTKANASELATLINSQRAKDGLPELTYDSSMQIVADERARELTTNFSHERPDGSRVSQEYYYAEIIHSGSERPSGAFQSYYDSTAHRNIMLSQKYTNYAVGCYKAENGKICWVVLFSK